jgi:hypothetical protein
MCIRHLFAPVFVSSLLAAASPTDTATNFLTFEGFSDRTILTGQYAGMTFNNTMILIKGISLDEVEFPPHSGYSVAADIGGPINITFSSPVLTFNGYFTYSVPLTVQALDSSNNVLASATSRFSNNEFRSGVPGSISGERLALNTVVNIAQVIITGANVGTSFTMDDVLISPFSPCDLSQDGATNVLDVEQLIDEVVQLTPAIHDLNMDGVVDINDIQIVLNAALGLGCAAK